MKKSAEILNLPIVSISEGRNLGTVKGLIINSMEFSVDFLTVEQSEWQVSAKAIPYKRVVGVGEYAVIVDQNDCLIDLSDVPFVDEYLSKNTELIGQIVLTKKGELVGEITEYVINHDTGQLESLCLEAGDEEVLLPVEHVISLGKECIIISDDENDVVLFKSESPEVVEEVEDNLAQIEDIVNKNKNKKLEILRKKQFELLKGKTVMKNIYNKTGVLLVPKGTVLTDDELELVENEGASVFIELSMNVRE